MTAVNDALLTLDDFPDGWTADPAPADGAGGDLDLSEDCQVLNQNALANEVVTEDSESFTGPEDQGVTSGVTVFRSQSDAAAALAEIDTAYSTCEGELLPEFERQYREAFEVPGDEAVEVTDIALNLEEVPFATDAGGTASFRIGFSGAVAGVPFEADVHVVMLQEGKLLAGLNLFDFEGQPDEADEHQIADTQLAKLRTANESLPD